MKLDLLQVECGEGNFLFLNEIFKKCVNLKEIKLNWNNFNDENLKGVDFSLISASLESFDINYNESMEDFSFLNGLFKKTISLKKLFLDDIILTVEKAAKIDFSLLPKTLIELSLQYNKITDSSFMNIIFNTATSLEVLNLMSSDIDT